LDEERNWLQDKTDSIHLTEEDYTEAAYDLAINENHDRYGISAFQYKSISDSLLAEIHKKYDLRPRPNRTEPADPIPSKKK
jgi:hypothetical protein